MNVAFSDPPRLLSLRQHGEQANQRARPGDVVRRDHHAKVARSLQRRTCIQVQSVGHPRTVRAYDCLELFRDCVRSLSA